MWYSTPAEANVCGGSSAGTAVGACAWQQLEVINTIAADCANSKVHEFVESVGSCFGAKPSGGFNRTTDACECSPCP